MNDKLLKLLQEIKELKRGCDCDYDYKCGNCYRIERIKQLAEEIQKENINVH